MSRFTTLTLLGVSVLSLGTVAVAQTAAPTAPRGGEVRQPLDRATLQTRIASMFDAADKNRDGLLSVEERKTQRTEGRQNMREQAFARLDTNKDGAISKEEFTSARGTMRESRQDRARPDNARQGKRERSGEFRGRAHGFGGMMMPGRLAEYRDKPIPRATFIEAGLSGFDRIDTNRDGKISAAERQASRKAMMERRPSKQRPVTPKPTS